MPGLRPGQSGHPSGRPRSAAGLREVLVAKFGTDAAVLVQRLEVIATGRSLTSPAPRLGAESGSCSRTAKCWWEPRMAINLDARGSFSSQPIPVRTYNVAMSSRGQLKRSRSSDSDGGTWSGDAAEQAGDAAETGASDGASQMIRAVRPQADCGRTRDKPCRREGVD